jgi:hypothetical protein
VIKYQYQYWHRENARTGIGTISKNASTSMGIAKMPVLVLALLEKGSQYRYMH